VVFEKNEENHDKITAFNLLQSALKKSPFYRISLTNYHNIHAASFQTKN